MILHRIVAPVTFADDSLEAAGVAAELAQVVGAELLLVAIAPLAAPDTADGLDALAQTARQCREQRLVDRIVGERLEELAGTVPSAVRTRTLLVHGPVGPALVDIAHDERADLVVVPIRRESAFGHLLHDHTDRYVLRHSDVPVLVVPTSGEVWRQPDRAVA